MFSLRPLTSLLVCLALGCAHPGQGPGSAPVVPISNPLLVTTNNEEIVWERAVDVLHDFNFEIGVENRLGRVIETVPKTGSNVLEPWHWDSVGHDNRWESTFQSIRRIVQVSLQPNDQYNGYLVSVVAFKETEDIPGSTALSRGGATFNESTIMDRNLDEVVGQTTPSVWVPLGRDVLLEQAILQRLQQVYSR